MQYKQLFSHPEYGKCPKILNSIVSEKMAYANSADLDQTAPESEGYTQFAIQLSINETIA